MYATHDDKFTARPVAAPGHRNVMEALAGAIKGRLQRWRRERTEDQAMVALASMDAHLLRDIGADRADLARLVRRGRD